MIAAAMGLGQCFRGSIKGHMVTVAQLITAFMGESETPQLDSGSKHGRGDQSGKTVSSGRFKGLDHHLPAETSVVDDGRGDHLMALKAIYNHLLERDGVWRSTKRPLRMSRRPDIRQPTGFMPGAQKWEMRH
jgi:hypothetical protein